MDFLEVFLYISILLCNYSPNPSLILKRQQVRFVGSSQFIIFA